MALHDSGHARSIIALLLAGRIHPSPMLEALGLHELCLPIGLEGLLCDAWLRKLAELPQISEVRVIVNTAAEVASVNAALNREFGQDYPFEVIAMTEPEPWRGAGGIVRDVMSDVELDDQTLVLICEAKRLPPSSLAPVLAPFNSVQSACGVVGVCGRDEPAGVYLLRGDCLQSISRVGYCDLKEQFLPSLTLRGERLLAARLTDGVHRLSNLESYLEAVRHSLGTERGEPVMRLSRHASISGSAVVKGHCIIEAGAVVEDGAIVHDSVVLWGATIGGGAIVSRSAIGPLAAVEPRARIVRQLVAQPRERSIQEIELLGIAHRMRPFSARALANGFESGVGS